MAEETTTLPPETTTDAPPAETPPPETTTDAPETTTTNPTPEAVPAEGTETVDDKPSPFDRIEDPEEIEAVIERLRERLPEEKRQPKPEVDPAAEAAQAEALRVEARRSAEARRAEASEKLNAHLLETRTKLRGTKDTDPDPDADYDPKLITEELANIIEAEVTLRSDNFRTSVDGAFNDLLRQHGGPIPDDRMKQLLGEVRAGKYPSGIHALFSELGERRYEAGLAKGQEEAQARDEKWRKAERAAIRAELMAEANIEPDAGTSAGPGRDERALLLDPNTPTSVIREIRARQRAAG